MASLYGYAPVIDKLLKAEADAKSLGPAGETLLMLAARNGNPEAIKLLIAAGVDVNAREPVRGTTALMWAVEQKHPGAVKALLDGGADLNAKTAVAGMPRNYMPGRFNVNAVEAAARRKMTAAANGRTYEEQLALEGIGGRFGGSNRTQLQVGQPGAAAGAGNRGQRGGGQRGATGANPPPAAATAAAAPAAAPAEVPEDQDDQNFIYSGLVGTGGGGFAPPVSFRPRQGVLSN